MSLRRARISRIDKGTAVEFLARYEHLGDVGLGVWHWGLVMDDRLASVLSFGVPGFARGRGFLGRVSEECGGRTLQLCRGGTAKWAPKNTPTRTIGLSLGEIAVCLGPSLIVAYADAHYSEVGTIYQAANGIYTGLTNPKGQADYMINGVRQSGWVVRKRYGTRCRNRLRAIDASVAVMPLRPKFRYVLLTGSRGFRRKARKLLQQYKRPYPKRQVLGISAMSIKEEASERRTLQLTAPGRRGVHALGTTIRNLSSI